MRCRAGAQRVHSGLSLSQFGFEVIDVGGDQGVAFAAAACNQDRADTGDGHAQIAEPSNQLRGRELLQCVVPIPGVRVNLGRFQQPDLVVVPQCFDTQVGHGGEASDADRADHDVLRWAGPLPIGERPVRSILGCGVLDDEQSDDLAVADPDVVRHDQRVR